MRPNFRPLPQPNGRSFVIGTGRDRADGANLDRIPDSTLDEMIVKQERTLKRSRWALEGVTTPRSDMRSSCRAHLCTCTSLAPTAPVGVSSFPAQPCGSDKAWKRSGNARDLSKQSSRVAE